MVGVFSHFARADEPGEKQNDEQFIRFNQMVADLAKIGINPQIKHLSNSAATLKNPSAHFDLVRTGISLYGLSPHVSTLGSSNQLSLKPVMQLRAKLHLVKSVPAGAAVGYGATAHTTTQTKLVLLLWDMPMEFHASQKMQGSLQMAKERPLLGAFLWINLS